MGAPAIRPADVALIVVPYDLGREGVGSGRGPEAVMSRGALKVLARGGRDVSVSTARRRAPFSDELEAVADVDGAVAALVADARREGRLPLVLAGNCNVTLGVYAGLAAAHPQERAAIIWLDAHGDFNTPETTETGYLDGMPLAMLTGRAHADVWRSLGGGPLDERLALHAGARDLDPAEAEALAGSKVLTIGGAELRGHVDARLGPRLEELSALVAGTQGTQRTRPPAYLHVDIDVLDSAAAPGVTFPSPGGLSVAELLAAVGMVRGHFDVRAVSLTSFTPENDVDDATLRACLAVLQAVTA